MKSFQDFKTILTEEEKSDYTKFDALVRAGLANKAQIQRIHNILDKMGEERPQFTNADRMIIQNLFTKMVDLLTNNKQIYSQTRRAVREELEEGIVATLDYKLGVDGQKVRSHRVKVGDTAPGVGDVTAPQIGDDPESDEDEYKKLNKEEVSYLEEGINPPFVLVLKRKAIRYYPEGITNVMYYNERLNRYFSVPYSAETPMNNPIQAENVKIKHIDGTVSTIDEQTADDIDSVFKQLSEDNQVKFSRLLKESSKGLTKVLDFVYKQTT
jgi:hypothetical protein